MNLFKWRSPFHELNKIKCDRNLNANEAIASIQNLIVTTSDSRDDHWIDRNFTAAEAIASIQNLIATTGIGRDDDWIDRNFTAAVSDRQNPKFNRRN